METEKPFNRVGINLNYFIMKKLKSIKGLLSREEMRQIQGGSGWCSGDANSYGLPCGCACMSDSNCIMGNCSRSWLGWTTYGTCCG